MRSVAKLVAAILVCEFAGIIGSVFTIPSIPTWYASIQKPSFNPPSWVFAPVWTLLFLLMGISLYLVWIEGWKKRNVRKAILIFGVQLALNVLWSLLFFGLKSPFYALLEIVILWLAILLTIIEFYKISKKAALLLVPYLLWVSFASILNFYVWMLNP